MKKEVIRIKNKNFVTYTLKERFQKPNEPLATSISHHVICYKNGKVHREDGPAVISSNGDLYWYKDGLRHREDGPAVIYIDGSMYWFKNDIPV